MTAMHLDLDEATLARLRARAERAGVSPEDFAKHALVRLLDQDPFEFVGAGSSPRLRGRDADAALDEGFGRD